MFDCDWSSDVCSSDLSDRTGPPARGAIRIAIHEIRIAPRAGGPVRSLVTSADAALQPMSLLGWSPRSEERRVGKSVYLGVCVHDICRIDNRAMCEVIG